MSDSSDNPRRSGDSSYRAVGDEGGLVVLPEKSEVKVLNPVASKIYSMLDGTHTRQAIIDAVLEEFDVSKDDVSRDLDGFLNELKGEGMSADE